MGKWQRRSQSFESYSTRNDHPWRTDSGYGIAARYLVDGLCKDLDLAVFAPVGGKYKLEYYFPDLGLIGVEPSLTLLEERDGKQAETVWDKVVPIYPGIAEDLGEQIVDQHFQHFCAEILWQIADIWALSRTVDLAKGDRIRWVIQPPIDFLDPIPQYIIDKLTPALKVVPWVQEAKERLEKYGLKNVADPIPLGINTDLWKPQDRNLASTAMASLGFEYDAFNISIVAANQYGRKAWDTVLKGIRLFMEGHPDVKVRLYLHTNQQLGEGWDIPALVSHLGLAEVTRMADQYTMLIGGFSENQIMIMHALADCVINAGLEGFGYSTIQAQAVGTPVIGLNAGATKDLIETGILVPPYAETLTPNLLTKAEPHPIHISQALEKVYETPRSNFSKGIQFVHDKFSWPVVLDQWRKFFAELDVELDRKCMKSGKYPPRPSEKALALAKEEVVAQ